MEGTLARQAVLDMDATELAEAIRQGNITSYEATKTYIEHQKRVNPAINAVVETRYTKALKEAKEKDNELDGAEKGPLYGVPISVKEAFDVQGMKTTGGLLLRKHLIARKAAAVIDKLKKAGAIILGKTNTPTLCFCQETDNKLYGRTNNPWDMSRTAGGSSGGEAALLATGGAAVGIGSDIGGSIRIPSHFNGVVGFKPGMNQVPSAGHFPPDNVVPLQTRMSGMGPIGKSVRDMELMYGVIVDNLPSEKSLEYFQIDVLSGKIEFPMSGETRDILDDIALMLKESHTIERSVPPYLSDCAHIWQEIMSADGGKSLKSLAFPSDRTSVHVEYLKEKLNGRTQYHSYFTWALIGAKLFQPSTQRLAEIQSIISQGDGEIAEHLEKRLLVLPVYHTAAPGHGKLYSEIFSIQKTFLKYMPFVAYANVWGLPSLTVPVAEDANGMPIGVQVIGKNGDEAAVFELGRILEKNFRGYVRCLG